MIKLIIFDCDGVMFDSKNANKEYYNFILRQFNRQEMSSTELDFVHIHNVVESINYIFRNYPNQNIKEVNDFRESLDYTQFLHFMRIEDDLVEFLEKTRDKFDFAISTNRMNTMDIILDMFNLTKYFGKVMTAQNSPRPKPAPDALIEILNHYECNASEAIYIGDSIIDREHSSGCSMELIAFKNDTLPAEYHINNFMEILDLPPFENRIML